MTLAIFPYPLIKCYLILKALLCSKLAIQELKRETTITQKMKGVLLEIKSNCLWIPERKYRWKETQSPSECRVIVKSLSFFPWSHLIVRKSQITHSLGSIIKSISDWWGQHSTPWPFIYTSTLMEKLNTVIYLIIKTLDLDWFVSNPCFAIIICGLGEFKLLLLLIYKIGVTITPLSWGPLEDLMGYDI